MVRPLSFVLGPPISHWYRAAITQGTKDQGTKDGHGTKAEGPRTVVLHDLLHERLHRFDHARLLVVGKIRIERQPDDTLADVFSNGTIAHCSAEARPHRRQMQRDVMKHAEDSVATEVVAQGFARRGA